MRLRISPRVPAHLHQPIRACVEFGFRSITPSAGVEVRVRPQHGIRSGRNISGVAYLDKPSDALRSSAQVVTLSIPNGDPTTLRYPRAWSYPGLVRAPGCVYQDWQEELVHTAAHEAAHVRQFRRGRPCSEVEAERIAVRRLAAWRTSQVWLGEA